MNGTRLWFVLLISALFPMYTFFQMSLMNVLGNAWLQLGMIEPKNLAYLSSAYLYADAGMLIFSGFCLDRFKLHILVPAALCLSVAGVGFLLISQNICWLILARIISGMGHAFALLSAFRVCILFFDVKRHGLAIGIVLTIAILGAVGAQAPFQKVIDAFSWQAGVSLNVLFGVVIIGILFTMYFVERCKLTPQAEPVSFKLLKQGVLYAAKRPVNYVCAFYTCFLSLPMMLLGMVWGNQYFQHRFHFNAMQASYASDAILIGSLIGFPLIGFLSDWLPSRKLSMLIFSMITFLLVVWFILFIPNSFYAVFFVLFLIGFFASCQAIAYSVVGEMNDQKFISGAMGFSNVFLMAATASIQLIINQFVVTAKHFNSHLCLLIIGALILLSVVLVFAIPDKKDR